MWKYPDEVIKYARKHVKGRRPAELAELINAKFDMDLTPSKVRALMGNYGLTNNLPGIKKGEGKRLMKPEEEKFVFANYKGTGHQTMADMLKDAFGTHYTKEQIKNFYARNKLNSGLTGRFEKGHDTWNKGRQKDWKGGENTQFKKGNIPSNRLPIGSERIDSKDGYTYVKIQDGHLNKNWKMKHVLVWEEHNGPLPKGHCIIFGDRDRENFDIDNLICVSRAQLVRMNQHGLIQNDVELTRTGANIAKVMNKIGERNRS